MTRILTVLGAVFLWALPVQAQEATPGQPRQVCMKHSDMVAFLEKQVGEKPIIRGLSMDGTAMLETYMAGSGTWTITITQAKTDTSCILFVGQAFTVIAEPQGDPA